MRKVLIYFLIATVLLFVPVLSVQAAVEIGQAAPAFSATDIEGQPFNLSDHRGKTVVLEWSSHECPFVRKHYGTGNMQATQETATDKGVIWVTVVSSAPGRQGYVTAEEAKAIVAETGARATTRILDPEGTIGGLYDARATPHMFVISEEGILVYAGAIDDKPSPRPGTVEGATNHVLAALADLEAGRAVQTPLTQPYGCAVKYAF